MSLTPVTNDIWNVLRSDLEATLPRDVFVTWIEPLRAEVVGDDTLLIIAPNDFAAIWLEDNYQDLLREKMASLAGGEMEIEITSRQGGEASGDATSEAGHAIEFPRSPDRAGKPRDVKKRRTAYLNPRNTFDNFIVGPSNQLAHAAALAVAAQPGNAYNPLFLYGDTGLGKTHLMHAVAHAIQANDPDAHVVYVSCEKFTNKFLKAIRENTLDEFRKFYRKVDVLLIDDVQFLEGKERTQEEFFHTFNELFESQRQICLSSDRPASEISRLESRLVSRFQWGMITDIQAPDLETRAAILRKKAQALGYTNLTEEVFNFLAMRVTRNVRRLEGALLKVAAYAKLTKHPLDLPMAEHLIKDILQEEQSQQVTIEKIQRKVADYYDLRMGDMSSRRRPSNIAFPRQIAMYLSRILTSHPLKEIGDAFGGRDHGTVIHACRQVENIMEQEPEVKRAVEYLTRQIHG
ncbi:MAG: chromosomal replication initiator protein DnaA [Verrucomicrobiota bacterium JB022]|nr:chromosomal replication initiator protein DnaA [Verrucomicrobiota bacterium JB022]